MNAAAKEISMNAALAAVFSELEHFFYSKRRTKSGTKDSELTLARV